MGEQEKLNALAGSCLSSSACFAALILLLREKGILSEAEERLMYQNALEMLYVSNHDPVMNAVYEMARGVIEAQLT
ncbi:hypothetical protein BRY73_19125 [Ochrobactrum sp. P6BS-III]|uniref:hypothetical protein n=1 Tax=unclassified Ochrobactrum TaxID=239106 RepID=UPI000993AED2|nr:hypothetical protein [Ochrobactrum sp. P6BSIII]OOL15405.1 hypothetical protein BRY73_19125 [Ochrobactrum sp. P6BS-III]